MSIWESSLENYLKGVRNRRNFDVPKYNNCTFHKHANHSHICTSILLSPTIRSSTSLYLVPIAISFPIQAHYTAVRRLTSCTVARGYGTHGTFDLSPGGDEFSMNRFLIHDMRRS